MIKPVHLAIAATALVLAGGVTVAQAADILDSTGPSRYVQMNSPGDGISSGARSTGNGRPGRRAKGFRRHRYHRYHR